MRTRDAVIFGLAKLAESRDPETGYHLERIARNARRGWPTPCARRPPSRQQITPGFIKLIGISSALHDIGKVGVQDSILLKPGRLAESERRIMQMHSAIGGKCIREIELRLENPNFLQMARDIALYHHERWDGGYPQGWPESRYRRRLGSSPWPMSTTHCHPGGSTRMPFPTTAAWR